MPVKHVRRIRPFPVPIPQVHGRNKKKKIYKKDEGGRKKIFYRPARPPRLPPVPNSNDFAML